MGRQPNVPGHILFVQYRDNLSGAPKVLSQVVRWAVDQGMEVTVLTSRGPGFLQDLPGVRQRWLKSRFGRQSRLPGWLNFLFLQLEVSIQVVLAWTKGADAVWFNTGFHPIPCAVSALLIRHRVVHVHEIHKPEWVGRILSSIAFWFATAVLFPSLFAMERSGGVGRPNSRLVPNCVEEIPDPSSPVDRFRQKRVVMAASLSRFKGIDQFTMLARAMPEFRFMLAVDASNEETLRFLTLPPPDNMQLLCGCRDRKVIFGDATIVVCLTIPRLREETFGLSVAEGLAWGIPAVVPPAGGVQELVEEGKSGFLRDPEDIDAASAAINCLLSDLETYLAFSEAARARSQEFGLDAFWHRLADIF